MIEMKGELKRSLANLSLVLLVTTIPMMIEKTISVGSTNFI